MENLFLRSFTDFPAHCIRAPLLHLIADPFYQPLSECIQYFSDALLVIQNGIVLDLGSYVDLSEKYAALPTVCYLDRLILPGLIDTHIHYPQSEIVAAYGEQLLAWLNRYTFPAEQKFSDFDYALTIAEHFLTELLRHGTTTALVFTTVYPQSTDAFFQAAQRRNFRMIAGKVLMDRHAPNALLDTPETAYADSKRLIEQWHKVDRLLYAVTPRFAITSTPEQLAVADRLLQEFPDVYLHTHLAENKDELDWTAKLFPEARSYLDVYRQSGLVGDRSVFAHGIHLNEEDLTVLSECGCAIAHCPTSNFFLGSGLFPMHKAKDPSRPIEVGLGTDVGGGTSFSLLQTGGEAYKVAQLQQRTLTPFQALFLATLGGAKALSLEDKIGNLLPGKEADFIIVDPQATATLGLRNQACLQVLQGDSAGLVTEQIVDSLRSLIFSLLILGDDRVISKAYVAGEIAHSR